MSHAGMGKLARHPRMFDQVLVLANGATVNVRTAVPKKVVKLATDPTVHPAWNPDSNKGLLDQTGQVSRFMRRFEGYYEQDPRLSAAATADVEDAAAEPASGVAAAAGKAAPSGKAAKPADKGKAKASSPAAAAAAAPAAKKK